MNVGDKVLFQQECTTELPPEFPTGTVFFENVVYQEDHFSIAVEFKDTLIVSVTYYLKARQDNLMSVIGYSDIKAICTAKKRAWTYVSREEKWSTVIVSDKKKIVIVRTLR